MGTARVVCFHWCGDINNVLGGGPGGYDDNGRSDGVGGVGSDGGDGVGGCVVVMVVVMVVVLVVVMVVMVGVLVVW